MLLLGLLSAVDELNSTVLNQCTLHFTWTAPYTLQGVPINYYTINITRHSGGAVLRSDTTNTTKYTYYPNILGEMLEISVAAANDAGTGEVSQIVAMSPSSSMPQISICAMLCIPSLCLYVCFHMFSYQSNAYQHSEEN